MLAPPASPDVVHIELMSPAMSRVPWVDKDLLLVFDNTSLIPESCFALFELSVVVAWVYSPAVADSMAVTSAAVLLMMSRFRFLKSDNWSAVCPNARSRD